MSNLRKNFFVALFAVPVLHKGIKDVVVLIHRPPQAMAFAVDGQRHFIHMPFVPGGPTATQAIGIILLKLAAPLPGSVVLPSSTYFFQLPSRRASYAPRWHAWDSRREGCGATVYREGNNHGHDFLDVCREFRRLT